jgi:ComF family protein
MVNSYPSALLDGLFPAYCYLCGLRSHRPLPLCQPCQGELQANINCCYRCAIPLPPQQTGHSAGICGRCQRSPPPFDRVVAPWLYCEHMAYLVQHWKYRGQRQLTPLLAWLWLQQATLGPAVDVIAPVPLHWRRLWRRGFNQAELLCRRLRWIEPAIAAAALHHRSVRRWRATPAQASMSASGRTANLRGAFTVRQRYDNLRVAIVDDVLTTGATAASLAGALREAGASHIEVWCLARTPAPGD